MPSLLAFLPEPWKQLLARVWAYAWKWVGTPLAGVLITVVFVSRFQEAFTGPASYTVYFVGDLQAPVVARIYDGMWNQVGNRAAIDGKPVRLQSVDDAGDPGAAAGLAQKLSSRADTLMVVGHGYSSTSKTALPVYLLREDPVPVILPTETNPSLLPPGPGGEFMPVFRLAPDDSKQAKTAAEFAMNVLRANTLWVIQDTANEVYSKFLATEFTERVHQSPGHIVVLSSTTGQAVPRDVLQALNVKCVFFAGNWSPALTVVRQVRSLVPNASIILSDGAASLQLTQQGGSEVNGVYLTHPRSAAEIRSFGYEYCGRDAGQIVLTLITEADQRFSEIRKDQGTLAYDLTRVLNMHRVTDARAVIRQVMKEYMHNERKRFQQMPSKSNYQFNSLGEPVSRDFHVWQIRQGRFEDVK